MARAMKRAASKSAGGARKKRANPVAKKCALIAPAIRAAESLPKPVRSIISDRLALVFGTYKEERHEFQNTVSTLVGKTLKATEADLGKAVSEAESSKAAAEAESSSLGDASNAANTASETAANAAAESKAALTACQTELKDAKANLDAAKAAVKTLQENTDAATQKRDGLSNLRATFFTEVKEGRLDKRGQGGLASSAGKKLAKDFSDSLETEFLACVVRSFSKASADWGTFDHLIDKELNGKLDEIASSLEKEISSLSGQKDPTAANVDTAAAAVGAAEEKVKAAEGSLTAANEAARAAKATAKAASDVLKSQEKAVAKAAGVLADATKALASFQEKALAAYAEVEAHTAPPPPPEPEEPAAADPAPLEQAMTAAPPQAAQSSPGILPSPGVLLTRAASAVGSVVSARLAPSPRVQGSPGRAS